MNGNTNNQKERNKMENYQLFQTLATLLGTFVNVQSTILSVKKKYPNGFVMSVFQTTIDSRYEYKTFPPRISISREGFTLYDFEIPEKMTPEQIVIYGDCFGAR